MLLKSRLFGELAYLDELRNTRYDLMQVSCNLPLFSAQDIRIQVSPVVKINNICKPCLAKNLWLRKGILVVEENLKLEVFCQLLDLAVLGFFLVS